MRCGRRDRKETAISVEVTPPAENTPRRDRAVDAALAAAVFTVVGVAIASEVDDDSVASPVAYLFGVFFAAPMFFRRRYPVAVLGVTAVVLVAYYALSFPPIGLALPLAAALYSAAEQGYLRWAAGVATGLLVLSTSVRIGQGDDLSYLLGFELAGSIGLMAAVIALGDSVRSRRMLRREMVRRVRAAEIERERESTRRVEQERLQIARDLHDLLAHTISVISLHTDVATEALEDDPRRARSSLTSVRAACTRAVGELHATVEALRAPADAGAGNERGPTPGLADLTHLGDVVSAAGVAVRVQTRGEPGSLSAVADATAYRVVQEALSNVLRHADATEVVVALDYRDGLLKLSIADNGRGPSGGTSRGWGLAGMRERVGLLGGTLSTEAPEGGGFVVEALIPAGGRP
ncbi:sensor histidine kinase [Rhodococcus chondri]|uniref:histidine kinase n=1 Tax=Rhodococcus chondri TaxID=3065941 RepID=A0ABU7JNI3_9NOCA|nr:sensor histidine kinase [Rhodococcus sp. CC-R104]MEE2031375.1 sensor histidine kinase [Rhodococcus sp. CC-R104]